MKDDVRLTEVEDVGCATLLLLAICLFTGGGASAREADPIAEMLARARNDFKAKEGVCSAKK